MSAQSMSVKSVECSKANTQKDSTHCCYKPLLLFSSYSPLAQTSFFTGPNILSVELVAPNTCVSKECFPKVKNICKKKKLKWNCVEHLDVSKSGSFCFLVNGKARAALFYK